MGENNQAIWVNGIQGAMLPADDPGIVRGMVIFETLRTYGTQPFRLQEHLDRLAQSAAYMGIFMPDPVLLRQEVLAAAQENVWIRVSLTLGGNRIVQFSPIDQAKVGREVTIATVPMPPPPYLPGRVKHCSRASWVLACRELGVDEVFFVDEQGYILEANRSNVIAVVDGDIWTPPVDGRILAGVTRGAMLEAAVLAGITVREEPLPVENKLDELYICSTLKELAPVKSLDGRSIGEGPVGRRLYQSFRSQIEAGAVQDVTWLE